MLDRDKTDNSKYAKYDTMSMAELQDFLLNDADALEADKTRWDELVYASALYSAQMQEICPPPKAMEESFAAFAGKHPEVFSALCYEREYPSALKTTHFNWRKASIVAAVAAILFCFMTAVGFVSVDTLYSAVMEWTESELHFIWDEDIVPGDPGRILKKYGITQVENPYWMPEGYEQVGYRASVIALGHCYSAVYQQQDNSILFYVRPYDKDANRQYQQSGPAEVFYWNGVRYYIFPSASYKVVVWMEDGCECDVSANLSKDQIKELLRTMNPQ